MQCHSCRMDIPAGARVCPFCQRDPRSQNEIDFTNYLVQAGTESMSKPGGLRQFFSLFLGMWFGVMGWLFTKEDSVIYGSVSAFIGFALPYLPYLFRKNEVITTDSVKELKQLSFLELGNSDEFKSLSAKDQFKYKFTHHPIKFTISIALFVGLMYLAIFQFNLPNELKINLDLLLTRISKSNSGQGQPETLNESNIKETANLIKPAQVQHSTPTASLEDAVKAIEGEIDYSFNKPLLMGIYGFEKRYPVFNTIEGSAEVERLNNSIAEKIKNLN
jgi:hypothetical protein